MFTIAVITLNIPDAALPRIIDAFCTEYNYIPQMTNAEGEVIPNPQTRAQFTKAKIIEHIKAVVKDQEGRVAAEAARQTKETEVNTISIT